MRVIAFLNLKGGVAKTATTVNTAAILAGDYGKRVLAVDADSQANTSEFLGMDAAPWWSSCSSWPGGSRAARS